MVFAKTALIKEHPMCHCPHLTIIEWEGVFAVAWIMDSQ